MSNLHLTKGEHLSEFGEIIDQIATISEKFENWFHKFILVDDLIA